MMEAYRRISQKPVSARAHSWAMYLVIGALLPMLLSFFWPRLDSASQLILGAITEHKTPTLITDSEGTITFTNMLGLELLGGEALPDVLGHNVTEWMEPELADRHSGYFEQAGKMPLGSVIPLRVELQVAGELVVQQLEIEVSEADKGRIYRLEFRDE